MPDPTAAASARQIEALNAEKFQLVGEVESLRQRVAQLQEQNSKPSGLFSDKSFLGKKKRNLQDDVTQISAQLHEAHAQLRNEADQRAALQQNLQYLQTAYQQAMHDAETCKKELCRAREEQEAERLSLTERNSLVESEANALAENVSNMEKEACVLRRQVALLSGCATAATDDTSEATNSGTVAAQLLLKENSDLTVQVQQLQSKLDQCKEDHHRALQDLYQNMLSQARQQAAGLALGLHTALHAAEGEAHADVLRLLHGQHVGWRAARAEIEVFTAENTDLRVQLACCRSELEQRTKDLTQRSDDLTAATESLAHMQRYSDELYDQAAECELLRKENATLTAQLSRVQINLQEKDYQLASTCHNLQNLESALAKKSAQAAQQAEQLGQLQHRAEQADAEVTRRVRAEGAARRQLEESLAEVKDVKARAEAHAADTGTQATQLESLQAALREAQGQLRNATSQLTQVSSLKEQLDIEVDQLSSELFVTRSQKGELQASLHTMAQELQKLREHCAQVGQRLEVTEHDTVALTLETCLLRTEVDDAGKRLAVAEVELGEQRLRCVDATRQQNALASRLEDAQRQADIDSRKQFMFIRDLQAQLTAANEAAATAAAASAQSDGPKGHRRVMSFGSRSTHSVSSTPEPPPPAPRQTSVSPPPNSSPPRARSTTPAGVTEEELILVDRVTRLQMVNWEMEERLRKAEAEVQTLKFMVARKDEVLQHWIAQRPLLSQEPPKRRLKGLLPIKSSGSKSSTQLQMQSLVEQSTIQTLVCEEQIAELQRKLAALQAHHRNCNISSSLPDTPTMPPDCWVESSSMDSFSRTFDGP